MDSNNKPYCITGVSSIVYSKSVNVAPFKLEATTDKHVDKSHFRNVKLNILVCKLLIKTYMYITIIPIYI